VKPASDFEIEGGNYATSKENVSLRLPVKECNGENRVAEANCAICLLDYEPGDDIVWSSKDKACSHAFHEECMMSWLVRGKKRCPVCRSFFVPSELIADQEKLSQKREANQSR